MEHPTIGTLMSLADGEESRTVDHARRHAESCKGCRGALAELAAERELTRAAIEESLAGVSFEGLSQRVMRAIEVERPVAIREHLSVWLREFLEHRRRVWVPVSAFATVALAAWLVLGLRPPPPPPEMGGSSVVSIRAASSAIVFDIPSEDGLSSTAVVWINDDVPEDGGSGS